MAFKVEKLFDGVQVDPDELMALTRACQAAGLEEAIDLAMVDEEMQVEILGDDLRLFPLLKVGIDRAKPLVKGWAAGITKYWGGVGGRSGRTRCQIQLSGVTYNRFGVRYNHPLA